MAAIEQEMGIGGGPIVDAYVTYPKFRRSRGLEAQDDCITLERMGQGP